MAQSKPRIKLQKTASKGEIVTIKTLINHKMESGSRKDKDGKLIPRMVIHTFSCHFNDNPIFECDIGPGISANPYLEFNVKVEESGTFRFVWEDDEGSVYTAERKIEVA